MAAYYNEIDPFAAAWLRELIKAGHIAPGEVDERSIEGVTPDELNGFTQCHFFAGIGGWSYALRLAGWPDDRLVWTGSCPCQPFSQAGKGDGFTDERHLWPAFHWLIKQCSPSIVFGEQVASKATGPWFDLVQADLEALGYAFGLVPFPAASVGAFHERDRAYWVADANENRFGQKGKCISAPGDDGVVRDCSIIRVANASSKGLSQREQRIISREIGIEEGGAVEQCGFPYVRVADTGHQISPRGEFEQLLVDGGERKATWNNSHSKDASGASATSQINSFWRDVDWLFCRDRKWRPVESGSCPLAHGVPARVVRLRGYGNAIVAPQAAEFVKAVMEV